MTPIIPILFFHLGHSAQTISFFQECGADCVKLQLSSLTAKFNKAALNRPYDSEHAWGVTYGAHKKHLEFSRDQVAELQQFAAEVDIPLTASAMDIVSPAVFKILMVPIG